jgi:hypothetical protein
MQCIFSAVIATAASAFAATVPAKATTFPSLTLIYAASGAVDHDAPAPKVATTISCTNLSGNSATMRVSFLTDGGEESGARTFTLPKWRYSVSSNRRWNPELFGAHCSWCR